MQRRTSRRRAESRNVIRSGRRKTISRRSGHSKKKLSHTRRSIRGKSVRSMPSSRKMRFAENQTRATIQERLDKCTESANQDLQNLVAAEAKRAADVEKQAAAQAAEQAAVEQAAVEQAAVEQAAGVKSRTPPVVTGGVRGTQQPVTTHYEVTLPSGVEPGDQMQVEVNGQTYKFNVPDGTVQGQRISLSIPVQPRRNALRQPLSTVYHQYQRRTAEAKKAKKEKKEKKEKEGNLEKLVKERERRESLESPTVLAILKSKKARKEMLDAENKTPDVRHWLGHPNFMAGIFEGEMSDSASKFLADLRALSNMLIEKKNEFGQPFTVEVGWTKEQKQNFFKEYNQGKHIKDGSKPCTRNAILSDGSRKSARTNLNELPGVVCKCAFYLLPFTLGGLGYTIEELKQMAAPKSGDEERTHCWCGDGIELDDGAGHQRRECLGIGGTLAGGVRDIGENVTIGVKTFQPLASVGSVSAGGSAAVRSAAEGIKGLGARAGSFIGRLWSSGKKQGAPEVAATQPPEVAATPPLKQNSRERITSTLEKLEREAPPLTLEERPLKEFMQFKLGSLKLLDDTSSSFYVDVIDDDNETRSLKPWQSLPYGGRNEGLKTQVETLLGGMEWNIQPFYEKNASAGKENLWYVKGPNRITMDKLKAAFNKIDYFFTKRSAYQRVSEGAEEAAEEAAAEVQELVNAFSFCCKRSSRRKSRRKSRRNSRRKSHIRSRKRKRSRKRSRTRRNRSRKDRRIICVKFLTYSPRKMADISTSERIWVFSPPIINVTRRMPGTARH